MLSPLKILTLDSLAGLTVGILTLALSPFITELYGWPPGFALFLGSANLLYGLYSGSLTLRFRSQGSLSSLPVILLIVFNSAWAGHCLTQVWYLWDSAGFLGLGHLLLEAIFVGGLAMVEARFVLIRQPA